MVTNKDIKAFQAFEDQVVAAAKNTISDTAKEMLSAPIQPQVKVADSAAVTEVKKTLGAQMLDAFAPAPYKCGYCGSPNPPIPYEEMYGPGAHGHDCCPDCGGV